MNKAYRFRLYPNIAQQIQMAKTFGCARFVYNKILADRITYYEDTGEMLNPTPAAYKGAFPWLKDVDSLALCNASCNKHLPFNTSFATPRSAFLSFARRNNT